jgi:hypothetical protein
MINNDTISKETVAYTPVACSGSILMALNDADTME